MSAKRLLYLEPQQMSAYVWQGGVLQAEGCFSDTPDGHAAFAEYAAAHPTSRFSLLADIDEEIHTTENIPWLRGSERRQLIARRLARHFPEPALNIVTSLGAEQGQRREEKLLFSSLGAPTGFEPWLKALVTPLRGLYAPSQLNGGLLRRLERKHSCCLLFTLNGNVLRENWMIGQATLFSRRLTLSDQESGEPGATIVREAGQLRQYLLNQRQLSQDKPLQVIVIAAHQHLQSIEQAAAASQKLVFSLIDPQLAAQGIKLRSNIAPLGPQHLYLHRLANSPPPTQFAPTSWRDELKPIRIRRGLTVLSLLTIVGSTLWAVQTDREIARLQASAQQIAEEIAALQQRQTLAAAKQPGPGLSGETLKRIVLQHAELTQQQGLPGPAWNMLSQALTQVPAATLDELDWKIAPPETSTAAGNRETLTLRGSIQFNPQQPGAGRLAFEQLVDHLRNAPSRKVSILQAPASQMPNDGQLSDPPPRRFAIEITRSLP